MSNNTEDKEKKIDIEDEKVEDVLHDEKSDEEKKEESSDEKKEAAEEKVEDKDPLEAAKEEIENLKDKYLRSVAEFDNYRKRTQKEKYDIILNGSEKAITAILPVLDDLERAIQNADKTEDVKAVKDGIELIYKKFVKTLEGLGVKEINTKDKDFDTEYHEAIAMVPGEEDKKGKIIDCVQTGYTLNDKVIRHAKVAVGQ
jgi:molecular chaperone GrpE